jgi:hypothetical protein
MLDYISTVLKELSEMEDGRWVYPLWLDSKMRKYQDDGLVTLQVLPGSRQKVATITEAGRSAAESNWG